MRFTQLIKMGKRPNSTETELTKVKIAITGMGALDFISQALEASFRINGYEPDIYVSPYNC